MALVNIDYGVGQDDMQGVFDKTNLAIDKINEIDNWQTETTIGNVFAVSSVSSASIDANIQDLVAHYNNKMCILNFNVYCVFKADTGGGDANINLDLQPAFSSIDTYGLRKNLIMTDANGDNCQSREIQSSLNGIDLDFTLIQTNNGGVYNRQSRFNFTIAYKIS